MSRKQTPSDFLKQIIGRPVVVKLNSGADYRGVLACLDSYMNIALEQTEEYVNGQLKNKYGDAFIRGNNAPRSQEDSRVVCPKTSVKHLLCESVGPDALGLQSASIILNEYDKGQVKPVTLCST